MHQMSIKRGWGKARWECSCGWHSSYSKTPNGIMHVSVVNESIAHSDKFDTEIVV